MLRNVLSFELSSGVFSLEAYVEGVVARGVDALEISVDPLTEAGVEGVGELNAACPDEEEAIVRIVDRG